MIAKIFKSWRENGLKRTILGVHYFLTPCTVAALGFSVHGFQINSTMSNEADNNRIKQDLVPIIDRTLKNPWVPEPLTENPWVPRNPWNP